LTHDTPEAVADGDDAALGIGYRVRPMQVILSAHAPCALTAQALASVEAHDLGAAAGPEFKEVCERFDADAPLLHTRSGVSRETDRHTGAP
jgi:hypothetical protein